MADMTPVKRVKNAVLFSNGMIRIDNVRGSYCHLDKPYKGRSQDGGDDKSVAKYSIVGIAPKKTHGAVHELILAEIEKIKKANKGAKVAKDKLFVRDGDDQDKDEYSDSWTISAREERKPKLRDANGDLVTEIDDIREMFQSGYWFSILIRPWYQDNSYGKRINAGLVGVMFTKEDELFGEGAIDDSDAWGDGGGKSNGMDDDDI